jgi:pyruvate dehydrogenase E2 component (dihydrolipoyllysine-residue acetyltransferase)
MAFELKLPELGENIESAGVLNVLVKPGDKVEKDQGIIEIETDKATIEVPSTTAGTVKDVLIKQGDNVKVGQTILVLENGVQTDDAKQEQKKTDETKSSQQKSKVTENSEEVKSGSSSNKGNTQKKIDHTIAEKSKSESRIIEVELPELGENIESADILKILVKKGDNVKKDQSILEIETDKATIEVPSTYAGIVTDVLVKEGEKAKVGEAIIKVETNVEVQNSPKQKTIEPKEQSKQEPKPEEKAEIGDAKREVSRESITTPSDNQPPILTNSAPAAPSTRRLARELGVDIRKVPGTGPGGRISFEDVKAYVKSLNEGRVSQGSFGIQQEQLPDFSKFGEIEKQPMNSIRTKTATHLSYAWSTIPHVTQHDKADVTELEKLRKEFGPDIEKDGGKLTITSILLKVSASALKVFPKFNSSINMNNKEIIYKKYFHVGVAVDTEHGLIVPVIKDVDQKNIKELSIELNKTAEKVRNRKISLEELQGICFTITNLGGIGGTSFTPIVNSPEVAILGVSRGRYEPVYNNEDFEPRLMLPLSLSYDHRIIDGADAARFLRWICEALEEPMKILVEG